jgi:formate dehydrogenase maturation protein FdhE
MLFIFENFFTFLRNTPHLPLLSIIYFQHEIETLNNEEFKKNANWLQMLTTLMEDVQDHETPESEEALRKWSKERDEIR